jgi:hypothetical protein
MPVDAASISTIIGVPTIKRQNISNDWFSVCRTFNNQSACASYIGKCTAHSLVRTNYRKKSSPTY